MTLPISRSFHMDRVHWVLEACRLLVLGTAQARQTHIRPRRPMCHSLRMRVLPHHSEHRRMRRRRFTIGAEGPHPLPTRRLRPHSTSRRRVTRQRVLGIPLLRPLSHLHHPATVHSPRPSVRPRRDTHRLAPLSALHHQDIHPRHLHKCPRRPLNIHPHHQCRHHHPNILLLPRRILPPPLLIPPPPLHTARRHRNGRLQVLLKMVRLTVGIHTAPRRLGSKCVDKNKIYVLARVEHLPPTPSNCRACLWRSPETRP